MEAATLTSPQRPKLNDVPVQKSLSLPSYARAGGGGIDHKLIFAALEQKEKGRRKSRLFTREKKNTRTTNIFCLPIPSSRHEKCRETSFSSDTSCSSLEYQKPKKAELKTKNRSEDSSEKLVKTIQSEENKTSEGRGVRTGSSEVTQIRRTIRSEVVGSSEVTKVRHSFHSETFGSNSNELPTITKTVDSSVSSEVVRTVEVRRSPIDHVVRLNVGSSDSMERSSRSSTDSFSRKERLVAIKARVEAEREKYGDSSSDEESRTTLSRYSSDGSLHRSVRDMKSRSSRTERRLRRRSQGEWSIQPSLGFPLKSSRKKLSLLNTEENSVQSSLERSTRVNNDSDHLITNTDFCPSPNFPDLVKKNYFSDFPSRENSARFVQARIRHLEDEERKRRSGSDFREKVITPPRQSPLTVENASPASTERRFQSEKQNSSCSSIFEKNVNSSSVDLVGRCSPLPRSSQAPTPPPRSPKSINFVNKAIIQHQNASLRNKEKNQEMSPGVSYPEVLDQLNDISDALCNNMKYSAESLNNSTEKHKFRELINNRRKTCGNFDFLDNSILSDLSSIKNPINSSNSISTANKKFSSVQQLKDQESKSFLTGSETPYAPLEEDNKNIKSNNKWQENDQKHEYMFNSLESKKSSAPSRHVQRVPSKNQACLCRMFPGENFMCICKSDLKEKNASLDDMPSLKKEFFNPLIEKNVCVLPIKNSPDRLCKSEVNISSRNQNKITLDKLTQNQSPPFKSAFPETNDGQNRRNYQKSASDNLESAMEELENVYRSLKFSSDNLSDLINVSNASLSDNGSKDMKLSSNDVSIKSEPIFKRRLSVCEANWKNDPHKVSIDIGKPNKNPLKTISALSSLSTSASYDKDLAANQLSIDELFKNMTQQLDNLEQNLLKNSENKDSQKSTCEGLDKNRFNDNKVSQISIRKQFYDNLCKSSQTPTITQVSAVNPKVNADRKKHKAVRSLSENISYLMTSPNSTKDKQFNAEEKNNNPHSHLLDRPHNGSINCDLSTSDAVCKPSNLFANKANCEAAQCPVLGEEIRHIRVSMDSDSNPSTKQTASSFQDSKQQYSRLSSALSCPSKSETVQNIATKTGVVKPNKESLPKESVLKDSFPKESILKDSVDVEGLEQLLNSLLGEVPDRQQSSSQGLSSCPATPPPAAGEMRVLQHLDVIRLKPVPS